MLATITELVSGELGWNPSCPAPESLLPWQPRENSPQRLETKGPFLASPTSVAQGMASVLLNWFAEMHSTRGTFPSVEGEGSLSLLPDTPTALAIGTYNHRPITFLNWKESLILSPNHMA